MKHTMILVALFAATFATTLWAKPVTGCELSHTYYEYMISPLDITFSDCSEECTLDCDACVSFNFFLGTSHANLDWQAIDQGGYVRDSGVLSAQGRDSGNVDKVMSCGEEMKVTLEVFDPSQSKWLSVGLLIWDCSTSCAGA